MFPRVKACFQQDLTLASHKKEMMIQFLLMELETVGNIRFEEGNTSDAWYLSSLQSSLSPSGSSHTDLLGLWISLYFSGSAPVMIYCCLDSVSGTTDLTTSLELRSTGSCESITARSGCDLRINSTACSPATSLHSSPSESDQPLETESETTS